MSVEILVRAPIREALQKILTKKKIQQIAGKLLNALESSDRELSLLITDDKEIHRLNAEWRGKDKPTDVLSFPSDNGEILGDVVISLPTLKRQAREYRVTPAAELLRLLIHGTLHLLGYDHEKVSKSEAERMRKKERELIEQLAPMLLERKTRVR